MELVFKEFELGYDEAKCTCWQFKDCCLHFVGTVQATDGDSLVAACALLALVHSEEDLKSKFAGKEKIFVAP
jgi:hypothetical protein